MCEGEGNGPVNALDNAIRQNVDRLAKYSKYLKDLKLVAVSYTHLTLPTICSV